MSHTIKTLYVIHHSHTDIGYTDLQERVIANQTDYIHTVLSLMEKTENQEYRWNCETLFCVEEFFKSATQEEKDRFCSLAACGKLGLSANYLNFTDLQDYQIYSQRLHEWQEYFKSRGVTMKTAMMADINGISMGYRNAMLENGIEFLFANIHCHHGMYPLFQNQNAFWWENAAGQKLLVWNGEHYNLGNWIGVKPDRNNNPDDAVEILHRSLNQYLDLCEENGYPYDFILAAVSGEASDNAPPSIDIIRTIEGYNKLYGDDVLIKMVSLQELYADIRDRLKDAPVYRGDMTDWWANGVGSTPYAVKHYKDALHRYHLCRRMDDKAKEKYPELYKAAQDNLMLYSEHTWGHSSTITNPYDTMVLNLDMRKSSYASKAHEAASRMLNHISQARGDMMRYYNTKGTIRVCSTNNISGPQAIEFYIESHTLNAAQIEDENGRILTCQVSSHPRGRRISFIDSLPPFGERTYTYKAIPEHHEPANSRKCYVGAERIRDIVNDYDPVTYKLPYEFENDFFRLTYHQGQGITSFIDKRTDREMLGQGIAPFFTPIYQKTPIQWQGLEGDCPVYHTRRILGRNIRGQNAQTYIGKLEDVQCVEQGPIFSILRLSYTLPGTVKSDVYLKFYATIPRIDFRLELGKTISSDIESVFLPLSLDFSNSTCYLKKGAEAFRPGIDQLPGSCIEFYMSDNGVSLLSPQGGALIAMHDTPMIYQGSMDHHPIKLCDGSESDNHRPLYSWIMNNNWETNFKMDLSGFSEFCYSMWLTDEQNPEKAMNDLGELTYAPYVLIVK